VAEFAMKLPIILPQTIIEVSHDSQRLGVAWGLSHPSLNIGDITPADQILDIELPKKKDWESYYISKDQV
jgi:hypothetical protein